MKKCKVCGKRLTGRQKSYCSPLCRFKYPLEETGRKRYIKRKETLCWDCDNACTGCSWSKSLIPVEGWTAKKTRIKISSETGEYTDSYFVIACPEFIPTKRRQNG